jgi:hypothetical protein
MGKDVTGLYLSRHAEPETQFGHTIKDHFGHVLVIPAYDEGSAFHKSVASIPKGPRGPVLLVLVVNAPDTATPDKLAANQRLVDELRARADSQIQLASHPPLWLLKQDHLTILIIDRFSTQPIPKQQGVGLARKIGCDLALKLWHQGQIASPWIHCTDADTLLPADYFEQITGPQNRGSSAYVYPFWHAEGNDDELNRAILLYEIKLRLFRRGLAHAGSPYAHHSIGSTMAIHAPSYAQVRGFPKRSAAEDFYLLNKLAKVGTITQGQGSPLVLQARRSTRAPFGTGPMLEKLTSGESDHERLYEHPEIFRHLGAWLGVLDAFATHVGGDLSAIFDQHIDATQYSKPLLLESLQDMNAFASIEQICKQYKCAHSRRAAAHTWFDGFRTLKLMHALQNRSFALLKFEELEAFWPQTGDLKSTRQRLSEEEQS